MKTQQSSDADRDQENRSGNAENPEVSRQFA